MQESKKKKSWGNISKRNWRPNAKKPAEEVVYFQEPHNKHFSRKICLIGNGAYILWNHQKGRTASENPNSLLNNFCKIWNLKKLLSRSEDVVGLMVSYHVSTFVLKVSWRLQTVLLGLTYKCIEKSRKQEHAFQIN